MVAPDSVTSGAATMAKRTKNVAVSKGAESAAPPSATNLLYYGDNLDVLRRHIGDESVDLVYLDPPFNSNADYNILFAERDGLSPNP
jgi:16S rRNA G966 N2-methylase RsmD